MLLSGETSRFQRSRRPGGRGSSTGSCSRSSAWRGTCRRSSSTPTTRRRTPRSSKPSMKTRTSCSSKRYISWNTSISSHHLTPFSRFANSSKPFACKDIKIALTEIMELSNTLEEAKEKVPSFWPDMHDRLTNRQIQKQTNTKTDQYKNRQIQRQINTNIVTWPSWGKVPSSISRFSLWLYLNVKVRLKEAYISEIVEERNKYKNTLDQ